MEELSGEVCIGRALGLLELQLLSYSTGGHNC